MVEFIQESGWVEEVTWERSFLWRDCPTGGMGFPCDQAGNFLPMEKPGWENLRKCLNGEHDVIDEGVVRRVSYYKQYAQIRCQCKAVVELFDPLTNDCRCGREYNMSGQLLRGNWRETLVEQWDSEPGVFSEEDMLCI